MVVTERRLPVFLVVDCSESMAGEAIDHVRKGIDSLVAHLRSDPHALETVHVCCIVFSRDAAVAVPLTELLDFRPPALCVRPGTALGAALRLLRERLEGDVVRSSPDRKGDFKPLVFLLTDGEPTDQWMDAAKAIRELRGTRFADLYAIGCGPDVNPETLFAVSPSVYLMDDLRPEAIARLFVWLSSSVRSVSRSVRSGDSGATALPPPPDGIERLESPPPASAPRAAAQLFLHAWCSRDRKPYLMRYRRNEHHGHYDPAKSHPLDELLDGDGAALPPVNASQLNGTPPCPYCENPGAGVCACGVVMCSSPAAAGPATCPKCGARLTFEGAPAADFSVTTSQG